MGGVRKAQGRLTFAAFHRLTGLSERGARKLLLKLAWMADPQGTPATYDPRLVDIINAMRGLPHRDLEPAHKDWLARYIKENS